MSTPAIALHRASSASLSPSQTTQPSDVAALVSTHTQPDQGLNSASLIESILSAPAPQQLGRAVEVFLAEQGYHPFDIARFSRDMKLAMADGPTTEAVIVDEVRPGVYKVEYPSGAIEYTDKPPTLSRQQEAAIADERARNEAGKQRDDARRMNEAQARPAEVAPMGTEGDRVSSDWFGAEEAHELLTHLLSKSRSISAPENLSPKAIELAKTMFQEIVSQNTALYLFADSLLAEVIPTPGISSSDLVNLAYGESPIAPDLQPLVRSLRQFLQVQLFGMHESVSDYLESDAVLFEASIVLKYQTQIDSVLQGL